MKTTGMETMTAEQGREIIREIMGAYDKYRAEWLRVHGNYEGYDGWFSKQVIIKQ